MKRSITPTLLVLFALVALGVSGIYILPITNVSAAGFSGKIFTTTFDGQPVNVNNYSSKDAVYLSGGPVHEGADGLPDGTYYFQVTGPSGNDLLSTDLAVCRQLIVAFGVVAAADGPACQHSTGIPNSSDGSIPVKLMPFNDTPNPGGNHKAWLIRKTNNTSVAADGIHINFKNADAKSEVFKVNSVPCPNCSPTVMLGGTKFYDANQNALFDDGEVPVEGVRIAITVTVNEASTTNVVTTNGSGNWSFAVPTGASYQIGEYLPFTAPPDEPDSYWALTAPFGDVEGFRGYSGTASVNLVNLVFGGICFRPNGIARITPCSVSYEPPPTSSPTPTVTPTPCDGDCPTAELSGKKFYDANQNASFNEGEVTVQGVRIAVVLTTDEGTTITVVTTNADGNWSLTVPTGAAYLVGEYVPDTSPEDDPGSYWAQTAPVANDEGFRGYSGTASENQAGLDFGDICFNSSGAASAAPCSVYYPLLETPTPTPTPDNQ
ncbi:MAG: hypothetical protein WA584_10110 [Pyrinomonadaceae bacterium]